MGKRYLVPVLALLLLPLPAAAQITDDFSSCTSTGLLSDNDPNWTDVISFIRCSSSNQWVYGPSSGNAGTRRDGNSTSTPDHYAVVEVMYTENGRYTGPGVRMDTVSGGYFGFYCDDDTCNVFHNDGSWTRCDAGGAGASPAGYGVGTTLKLQIVGTTLSAYYDTAGGSNWTPFNDSPWEVDGTDCGGHQIADGYPGVVAYWATTAVDNWEADDVVTAPPSNLIIFRRRGR